MTISARRAVFLAAITVLSIAGVAYPAAARMRSAQVPKVMWYYEAKPWAARQIPAEGSAPGRSYYRFMVDDLSELLQAEGKNGWELASMPLESPRFIEQPRGGEKVWVIFKRTDAP